MKRHVAFVLAAVSAVTIGATPKASPPELSGRSLPVTWVVTLVDREMKDAGTLTLEITQQRGRSCLSDYGTSPYLVVVKSTRNLSDKIRIGEAPVALFRNGRVQIDLSAPMCDAYLQLAGKMTKAGAEGHIDAFSIGGGKTLGTFVARVL
jgi:hypothetical protein